MLRTLTVIGARPQFIKAAIVSQALRAVSGIEEIVVHTGQHYDANMSEVFFVELGMSEPDYNLGVGSGPHGQQTGQMLGAIEQVMLAEKPDVVLVFGDTNSTLAGALAAAKLNLPIAHVEAGLRSYNRAMPEEVNRVLTDHLADLLFAPTHSARSNLVSEGIADERIHLVGDVMYDMALLMGQKVDRESRLMAELQCARNEYILATIHRAENVDNASRMQTIFSALAVLAKTHPVVVPLHPRTRAALSDCVALPRSVTDNVRFIEPVGYLEMVALERGAAMIVTDSGGVQKEAYFHQVPCITVRDETEWVELVEAGWNRLVPPIAVANIVDAAREAMASQRPAYERLYGDGDSANRIAQLLVDKYAARQAVDGSC